MRYFSMRRQIVLLLMALGVSPASAQNTQVALTSLIAITMPDNAAGTITPSAMRAVLTSMVLSSTCAGSSQIISWNASLLPACVVAPFNELIQGATTPTPGSSAATGWLWGTSTARAALTGEASIWSGKVYNGFGLAKQFDSSNNSAVGGTTPNVGLFAYAENAGSNNDVVGSLSDCVASVLNTICFGGNFIARNQAVNGTKLVGMEVDVEFAGGTTVGAGSGGIYINGFNVANMGPALQTGGVGGGTWTNGIVLDGIASAGAGLVPNGTAAMDSLLNCGAGNFSTACAIFGTKNLSFASSTGSANQVPVRQGGGGLAWGSTRQIIPLNTTPFVIVTTSLTGFFVGQGGSAESTTQALSPISGSFKNLFMSVNVAPGVGKNLVFTVRANGVDGAVTCTISGVNTTCSDTTHSVSISAGQSYDVKVVADAASAASIGVGGIEFDNP